VEGIVERVEKGLCNGKGPAADGRPYSTASYQRYDFKGTILFVGLSLGSWSERVLMRRASAPVTDCHGSAQRQPR